MKVMKKGCTQFQILRKLMGVVHSLFIVHMLNSELGTVLMERHDFLYYMVANWVWYSVISLSYLWNSGGVSPKLVWNILVVFNNFERNPNGRIILSRPYWFKVFAHERIKLRAGRPIRKSPLVILFCLYYRSFSWYGGAHYDLCSSFIAR